MFLACPESIPGLNQDSVWMRSFLAYQKLKERFNMIQTITTNSFEETQKLGSKIAKELNGVNILALYGDLGSGKTTFIQGFAKGLEIRKKIISPTFIIMRTYEIPVIARRNDEAIPSIIKNYFYHVDLYRIKSENELQDLGILDLMQDPQNLLAIEWPEKIEYVLPEKRINIYFKYIRDDKRKIEYEK